MTTDVTVARGDIAEPEGCESCPDGGYCDGCFYSTSEAREHRAECRCALCLRWGRILAARIHEGRILAALRQVAMTLAVTA